MREAAVETERNLDVIQIRPIAAATRVSNTACALVVRGLLAPATVPPSGVLAPRWGPARRFEDRETDQPPNIPRGLSPPKAAKGFFNGPPGASVNSKPGLRGRFRSEAYLGELFDRDLAGDTIHGFFKVLRVSPAGAAVRVTPVDPALFRVRAQKGAENEVEARTAPPPRPPPKRHGAASYSA